MPRGHTGHALRAQKQRGMGALRAHRARAQGTEGTRGGARPGLGGDTVGPLTATQCGCRSRSALPVMSRRRVAVRHPHGSPTPSSWPPACPQDVASSPRCPSAAAARGKANRRPPERERGVQSGRRSRADSTNQQNASAARQGFIHQVPGADALHVRRLRSLSAKRDAAGGMPPFWRTASASSLCATPRLSPWRRTHAHAHTRAHIARQETDPQPQ